MDEKQNEKKTDRDANNLQRWEHPANREKKDRWEGVKIRDSIRRKFFLRYQSIDKAPEEQTSTVKQEYTDE